jgi:hypothetical protein
MVMYGRLIKVMYTGGNLFRISRTRDPDSETRRAESSRTRTRSTCRSYQAELPHWRSPQGKQPIYLTHHWDRRWTVKVKVHSSKSIVLPLAGVKITVTIKSQTYLLHNLRLHALLPQVRKECRVIKRFITSWCLYRHMFVSVGTLIGFG